MNLLGAKYLANCAKVSDGVTLSWREAAVVGKHNSYKIGKVLFKFGKLTKFAELLN